MREMKELDGVGAILAGTANVVMQLSRPGVGYGVVESRVESGQLMRHPMKRSRTTFTYLAVALLGSDKEREVFRSAVDRAHVEVRSGPESPVPYNAFDPELQKWVGACLYYGAVDVRTRLRGPMTDDEADGFYREGSRLATTLQVRPEDWPADRAGFERYWEESLSAVSIDAAVRDYLYRVIRLAFLPGPLRHPAAGLSQFLTTGFLPPVFREQMGLPWSDADQRRFDSLIRVVAAMNRLLPPPIRSFPLNACLWDMRLRVRFRRPLV